MNPSLQKLQPYPFERLAQLLQGLTPSADMAEISLAIGEPKHPVPGFILDSLQQALPGIGQYPNSLGSNALRESIASWLSRRFGLGPAGIDPATQVLPVAGTREALFAFAQTVVDRSQTATVLMPNPFYQIYEGASLLAGAVPVFIANDPQNPNYPDFASVTDAQWRDCQLLYICSPGNPTGSILSLSQLQNLIHLAHKHDFIIASDECYSEIYLDETKPPPGLLQAAHSMGVDDYSRCVVFHSLSKRSNVPGMRSGFVAGDARILEQFRRYRTYHGCTMSPAVQAASAAAWSDEHHVKANRLLYKQKFDLFLATLDAPSLNGAIEISPPSASFYLWPRLHSELCDDASLTQKLYADYFLRVVPGRFLAREVDGINPGINHIRISLVASLEECRTAAQRFRSCLLDFDKAV